jgi:serine/threonine-protein kinase
VRTSIPVNVDAAIRKALEKLPADRFTGAQDFARAWADPGFRHGEVVGKGAAASAGIWKRAALGFAATTALLASGFLWAATRPEAAAPVLRHSMMVPEEMSLWTQFGPQMAVSADGSQIAFSSLEEGVSMIRLLERDQLESRVLDGTEEAWNPFFSPDGTRVGFITFDRQLKVVSLGGEPPLTVVDSGLVRAGGSWSRDGYIYFTQGASTTGSSAVSEVAGLGRVLGTGGPIETMTTLDTTRNELVHVFPDVMPNGRGVLFSISRDRLYDSETMEIAVADLETGEHHVLLQGLIARWSPTGHVLVVRDDGALLAAPLNPETLELEGPAVPLLDGVAAERLGGQTGLPSSAELVVSETGTLVYRAASGLDEAGRWAPVWVTREGAVQEIDPDLRRGDFNFPELSPDGGRLAVALGEAGGGQVWIKQLDRGPISKLTFQGELNFRSTWTPDGRTVAFVSNRGGDNDLYTRVADGSAQAELLLDDDGVLNQVTYSPDGEWIVYRINTDLFARRLGGDEDVVRITESTFNEMGPQVSPDGRWIAYASNESGPLEVYVHPFPNVTEGRWIVSTGGGYTPRWAHGGRELFYVGLNNQMMAVPIIEGTTFVYGDPLPLFPLDGFRVNVAHPMYDVAPEDDRFLMLQGLDDSGRVIVVDNFFQEMLQRMRN